MRMKLPCAMLLFVFIFGSVGAAELTTPASGPIPVTVIPMSPSVSTPATPPVTAVTTSVVVPTPVTESVWTYILANVLDVFQTVVKTLILTMVLATLTVVAKHFNLTVTAKQQEIVTNAVNTAVTSTEAWATAHKDVPSSNDKLNYAINAARVIAGTDIAKNYTSTQLSHMVEEAVYHLFGQTDPNDPVTETTVVTPTATTTVTTPVKTT